MHKKFSKSSEVEKYSKDESKWRITISVNDETKALEDSGIE